MVGAGQIIGDATQRDSEPREIFMRTGYSRWNRHQHPIMIAASLVVPPVVTIVGCGTESGPMNVAELNGFAAAYTAAWSSQEAASVAAFYSENGSLTINEGSPSVGRLAVTEAAQGFMTAFPDLHVMMDSLTVNDERIRYHWTFTGTNTGPGGTGRAVRISGYEEWRLGHDGLIAESRGHFDEAEYQRQLEVGVDSGR